MISQAAFGQELLLTLKVTGTEQLPQSGLLLLRVRVDRPVNPAKHGQSSYCCGKHVPLGVTSALVVPDTCPGRVEDGFD